MQRKAKAASAPKKVDIDCPISMEPINDPTTTLCGHTFEKSKLEEARQSSKECPLCRAELPTVNQPCTTSVLLKELIQYHEKSRGYIREIFKQNQQVLAENKKITEEKKSLEDENLALKEELALLKRNMKGPPPVMKKITSPFFGGEMIGSVETTTARRNGQNGQPIEYSQHLRHPY